MICKFYDAHQGSPVNFHPLLEWIQANPKSSSSEAAEALCRAYLASREALGPDHGVAKLIFQVTNLIVAVCVESIVHVHWALVLDPALELQAGCNSGDTLIMVRVHVSFLSFRYVSPFLPRL